MSLREDWNDIVRLWRHPRGREAVILAVVLVALFFAIVVRLDWIDVL